jgi:hypothetical protein
MIPPKIWDIWIPKLQITIGKVTYHAILDPWSNVFAISKELYDQLEICAIEKCDIDLLISNTSTKNTLGRVDNGMVDLHITSLHIDFIVMDMGSNFSSPIIVGIPFFWEPQDYHWFEGGHCEV